VYVSDSSEKNKEERGREREREIRAETRGKSTIEKFLMTRRLFY